MDKEFKLNPKLKLFTDDKLIEELRNRGYIVSGRLSGVKYFSGDK